MKTKNLTFYEAVQAMKKGKRVRREKSSIIHKMISSAITHKTNRSKINFCILSTDVEATDWEVVEKKTLNDKVFNINDPKTFIGTMFRFSDVKEALQKYRSWLSYSIIPPTKRDKEEEFAKKIFGEDLL